MGIIQSETYATWSAKQSQQFPVPDGHVGIRGIFTRGANLSKVLVQSSDGERISTIPARDVAVQTDDKRILPEDFVPLNWRLKAGQTISLTPTTSSAANAEVYVMFARGLEDPEFQYENKLFTSTDSEPFDLVDVPDGKTVLEAAFVRGVDLEKVSITLGQTQVIDVPCRDIAVDSDTRPFTFISIGESVSPNTKVKAISVNHGTGGAADFFARFS